MKLHEAISQVLLKENTPMASKEIAKKINEQKLYVRADRQPITATQIRARVNNYSTLFRVEGNLIYINDPDSLSNGIEIEKFISSIMAGFGTEALRYKKIIILLLFYSRIIPINIPRWFQDNYIETAYPDFKKFISDFTKSSLSYHKINFKNFLPFFQVRVEELKDKNFSVSRVLSLLKSFSEFDNAVAISIIERLHHSILQDGKNSATELKDKESIRYIANQLTAKEPVVLYETSELSLVFLKDLLFNRKIFLVNSSDEVRVFHDIYSFLYKIDSISSKALEEERCPRNSQIITYGSIDMFSSGRPKKDEIRQFTWQKIFKLSNYFHKSEKVFCITFQPDLKGEKYKPFRKELIEAGKIKSVTKLVQNSLLNSGVDSYLLQISSLHRNSICFTDLNNKSEGAYLSNEVAYSEVIENGYSIDSNNYLHPQYDKLKKFLSNESTKYLKDVIKKTIVSQLQQVSTLRETYLNFPILLPRDFTKDNVKEEFNEGGLTKLKDYNRKTWALIEEPALLIPIHFIGRKALKYNSYKPLIIAEGIVALIPDREKINLDFLHDQLNSEFSRIQIEMFASGTLVKSVSIKNLRALKIFVPSLEDQEISIQERNANAFKRTEAPNELGDHSIISILEHSLKQNLGAINNDLKSLKKYILRKEDKKEIIAMGDPISTSISSTTVAGVFDRLNGNYNTIQANLSNMKKLSRIDDQSLSLEKTLFKQYVEEIINHTLPEKEEIYRVIKISPNLKITIDKTLFYEVIKNLVINSIQHSNKKELVFGFTAYNEKNLSVIEYWDNGDGFPDNFVEEDYKSFGSSFGKTKGSGLGGFIINRVVEKHNGTLDIVKERAQRGFMAKAKSSLRVLLSEEGEDEVYQSWEPGDQMASLTFSNYNIKIELPNFE